MKKKLGRWFTFSPMIVGILRLLVSVTFWLLNTVGMTSELGQIIKTFINRGLGMFALISLPLMIIGIVFLSTAESKNAKLFTVKEIVQYSRNASKKYMSKFLLGFGIYVVFQIISSMLGYSQEAGNNQRRNMLVTFGVLFATLWIGLGYKKLALNIVHDVKVKSGDIFVGFSSYIKYVGAYAISYIIIALGLILFIVPGVIFALRLSLVPYLIIDQNLGIMAAIKTSWKMTKGYIGDIFLLNMLAGLINILGFLAIIVGLLWTVPLLIIANAYLYDKIIKNQTSTS